MRSLEFIPKSESCVKNLCDFLRVCDFFSHIIIIDNPNIAESRTFEIVKALQIPRESIIITISLKNRDIKSVEKILQKARDLGIFGVIFVSGDKNNKNCKNDKNYKDSTRESAESLESKDSKNHKDSKDSVRNLADSVDSMDSAESVKFMESMESVESTNLAESKNSPDSTQSKMQSAIKISKSYDLVAFSATNDIQKARFRLDCGVDFIITQSFYEPQTLEDFLAYFSDKSRIIPSFLPFFSQEKLDFWRDFKAKNLGIKIPKNYQISQNSEILRYLLRFERFHISMTNADFTPLSTLLKSLKF